MTNDGRGEGEGVKDGLWPLSHLAVLPSWSGPRDCSDGLQRAPAVASFGPPGSDGSDTESSDR